MISGPIKSINRRFFAEEALRVGILDGNLDALGLERLRIAEFDGASAHLPGRIHHGAAGATPILREQPSHFGVSADLFGTCYGRRCPYDSDLVRYVP